MALLEVESVSKSYGDGPSVLDKLNLDVDHHEVVCIIGGSGSGKSTLLRCINALESIDSGVIRLANDVVSGRGVDVNALRQRVGMVFQSYNLFPNMSVRENITLAPMVVGGVPKKEAIDRAVQLLEQVGLADRANDLPDQLSGGQQQRVAIARALAMDPVLMLFDEVTSALDPELVGEVLTLIRGLAAEGMTMILATHEMGFARDVANRVCFLHAGAVYEEGPPEQIFNSPQREMTQAFLRRIIEARRL